MTQEETLAFYANAEAFCTRRSFDAALKADLTQEMILHYLETEATCTDIWHCYGVASDRLDPRRSRPDAAGRRERRSQRQRHITPQRLQAREQPIDLYITLSRQPPLRRIVLTLTLLYGFRIAEVARMLGYAPGTIAQYRGHTWRRTRPTKPWTTHDRRRHGMPRRSTAKGTLTPLASQVRALRTRGMTQQAIADTLAISRNSVQRLLTAP